MKSGIHPTYYPDARITCACGAVYTVGSTKKEIRVEVCSKCHPFFTGQRRVVHTAGRAERFVKKYGWGQQPPVEEKKGPKAKKGAEEVVAILEELEAGDKG
ncbi:MAG: 50S ribosomal protein L31 [Firmicutes bacterium]|nr:50S ribosomal protein L31 [Bacillota bacterium]